MLGVVVSEADSASVHIGEWLREIGDWTAFDDTRPAASGGGTCYRTAGARLRTIEELHLDTENVAAAFDDPDAVVFVSRHAGETGPLLTAHYTGNLGAAEYGGEPHTLAPAAPGLGTRAVAALGAHAPPDYDVSLECTHHGPTAVGAPSLFVELGSAEDQWQDPDAARAVARAVLDLRGVEPRPERTLIAAGGGHYAPRPTRIARETDWAMGHVCADWGLDNLDADRRADVLEQAAGESGAAHAVVDGDRPAVERALAAAGSRVVSETWVRETEGVPLPLVDALEDALCPVDDGLRFGAPARGVDDASVEVVTLPEGLVSAAHAVDAAATVDAVAERALGYETTEAGNRVGDRAALVGPDADDRLVDDLAAILAREYEVERAPDAVRVREAAFDPALARERGVPEGPKFGRLAEGEAVTVDGEEISPDAVTRERTTEYPV